MVLEGRDYLNRINELQDIVDRYDHTDEIDSRIKKDEEITKDSRKAPGWEFFRQNPVG